MLEYKLVFELEARQGNYREMEKGLNTFRPHSALGGLTPQEFMKRDGRLKMQVALTLGQGQLHVRRCYG